MDATSIFIIVIATALAIIFKLVLYRRIQGWMDRDLIKGLAADNEEKHAFLLDQYQQLKAAGVHRKHYHSRLTELAAEFEQKH
ncbi:hypothetical protein [Neptuniibacter halophilus]|uniref:hypothetical protein n=1 Tax=Neptuniibacter halophilus TaxID=651666 RepID=UPI0025730562|nr:hypothetical protein [Neptuniibacter halophilus]